jgi:hypothetical protein
MVALKHSIIPPLVVQINQLTELRSQFIHMSDTSKRMLVMRYLATKPRLWILILKYLLGSLSIAEVEIILSRVYGIKLKIAIISDPGIGMDMDLPEDYQKLSDYVLKTKIQVV